jgi:hypothetical protein
MGLISALSCAGFSIFVGRWWFPFPNGAQKYSFFQSTQNLTGSKPHEVAKISE